ncbi:Rossmann fold nucleotide-binding protein, TIGR00730 family [Haloferula helveola]|uniref:AMP nucleosidase n=1 Tax=Haloferula helveola TaxID=490095 RepID=A0ABN6HC59_9BACT|nr:Rossmann fold nucleotide-binding protein, TIGR00730 family [Haloferula helveola]
MSHHARKSPVPVERDFTAGLAPSGRRSFIGSTGDAALDERIVGMAREEAGETGYELLAEMMITAVRLSKSAVLPGDFKLMNRALKEMREAETVFEPWRDFRKVAVFGSARTKPDEPSYQAAVEFSRKMREHEFMTITGAGPGIMAAGNEGAGAEDSFGLNIVLPFEATANEFIAGDDKLVEFNYFFTRKLSFVKESDAAAGFPGGFGTMDEVFEALTLIQTGKAQVYPLVLVDEKGGTYWKFWEQFVRDHLLRPGLISEADLSLFKVTDDIDEAVEEVAGFYRVFHSYRYVGDKLVMRLMRPLTDASRSDLETRFSDVIKAGGMEQRGALDEESNEPRMKDLPRLVFRHRRGNFGRLRELIDAVNRAQTD